MLLRLQVVVYGDGYASSAMEVEEVMSSVRSVVVSVYSGVIGTKVKEQQWRSIDFTEWLWNLVR
ncbi:hypothetical protein Hanom_Chr04g00318031 [Helianthus anomalus]